MLAISVSSTEVIVHYVSLTINIKASSQSADKNNLIIEHGQINVKLIDHRTSYVNKRNSQ